MSHARASFHNKQAQNRTESPVSSGANQYELMLYKLAEDKRRLKDVQSIEKKAEVKLQLIPEYLPWIDGVIAGNQGVQDDVLITILVWACDVGDLPLALRIATYAITHQLATPDQYQRTTACLIAEEFAEHALRAVAAGKPQSDVELFAVASLTENEDMPDEVRAKLFKAIGYTLRAEVGDAQTEESKTLMECAVTSLKRALSLHDKSGVKRDIELLERAIKKLAVEQKPD